VTRDITGFAGARYAQGHEGRGSPDDAGGEEPTISTETSAFLRYVHVLNRVSFTGDLDALKLDYDDVGSSTASISVRKAAPELSPSTSPRRAPGWRLP